MRPSNLKPRESLRFSVVGWGVVLFIDSAWLLIEIDSDGMSSARVLSKNSISARSSSTTPADAAATNTGSEAVGASALAVHSLSAQRPGSRDETKHADASMGGHSALAKSSIPVLKYSKWDGLPAIVEAADGFQNLRSSDSSIDALLCKLDQLDLAFTSAGVQADAPVLDMELCARLADVMSSLSWTCAEITRLKSPLLMVSGNCVRAGIQMASRHFGHCCKAIRWRVCFGCCTRSLTWTHWSALRRSGGKDRPPSFGRC